jgi:hypothetical protein
MDRAQKIVAIAAITQLFKYYGAPSGWCPAIAIVVGVILEYGERPNPIGILDGLILGAIVAGGYGLIKGATEKILGDNSSKNLDWLEPDDDRGV